MHTSQQFLFGPFRLDPTNARLHHDLADAYFRSNQISKGLWAAQRAWELDNLATRPKRKLTDPQRKQVLRWLTEKYLGLGAIFVFREAVSNP